MAKGKEIAPNQGGRPRKLAEFAEAIDGICKSLELGMTMNMSTALYGVPGATAHYWMAQAKINPDSEYGALLKRFKRAVAKIQETELRVLHAHSVGTPAQYEMEPALDAAGNPIYGKDGNVAMKVARDGDGKPIIRRPAIHSDWRAAAWMLEHRFPMEWALQDRDLDAPFDPTNPEAPKDATDSFQDRVRAEIAKARDDV